MLLLEPMKIAIITGGETGEREVSIKSAQNIQQLIDFAETTLFTFPENQDGFLKYAKNFDLVIPVIHGVGGEDGILQGLLKSLAIPFLFSNTTTHSIAIDKKYTKEIISSLGILSPKETPQTFPVFVKPRLGGSSVASKLCTTEEEMNQLLSEYPHLTFLTEEPIKGREFTVGILEYDNKVIKLPIIEIIPKNTFFDFESKYDPEKLATEICPAEIPDSLTQELQEQALMIHKHLEVRHISRSDFIVTNENKIYFLEINTIPGMTNTSLIPKMTATANLSLKNIFKSWCIETLSL